MTKIDIEKLAEILDKPLAPGISGIVEHALEQEVIHVRRAQPTPNDVKAILKLEALAFAPEEERTQDPPETYDGIERFLKLNGDVYIISRDIAFLEKIPLEEILNLSYNELSASSPLRQIAEKGVLQRAKSDYSETGKELWYMHGVGTAIKRLGSDSVVGAFALLRVLEILTSEQKLQKNQKLNFGYVDVGPTINNINIPAFKLFFKVGAVIDGYEKEVYTKGVPYLRLSHGADYNLDPEDKKSIDLSKRTYKHEIRKSLDAGYIGTQLNFDRETKIYSMVFQKQLNK